MVRVPDCFYTRLLLTHIPGELNDCFQCGQRKSHCSRATIKHLLTRIAAQEVPRPPPEGRRHGRVRLDRRFQRNPLQVKGEHFPAFRSLNPISAISAIYRGIHTTLRLRIGLVCGSRFLAESSNWLRRALRYTIWRSHSTTGVASVVVCMCDAHGANRSFCRKFWRSSLIAPHHQPQPAVTSFPSSHPTSSRLPEAHTDMHADSQEQGREPQGPPRMEL